LKLRDRLAVHLNLPQPRAADESGGSGYRALLRRWPGAKVAGRRAATTRWPTSGDDEVADERRGRAHQQHRRWPTSRKGTPVHRNHSQFYQFFSV
jgi:hypothetical protein